jgi:hypothetical protein
VTIGEPTFELASRLVTEMQKRQIEVLKLSINFRENVLQRWIENNKLLHIWPGDPLHQGLIDIYA